MAKNCQKIENFISNVEGQDGLTIRNSFPPCLYIVTTLKFTSNIEKLIEQNKQKWPIMAGLSTCQSGSKGSKRVNLDVFDHLGPSGLFWTISTKSTFAKPYSALVGQQIDFCLKWSKSVLMGPKVSQIVKKI